MKKTITTDYAEALWEVLEGVPQKELQRVVSEFVKLLHKNRMLHRGSSILRILSEIIDRAEGRGVVTVRSARELDESEKKKLLKVLTDRYGFSTVELKTSVDPALLGGLEVSWNWRKIDNTIRGRLLRIREQIAV